MGKLEWNELIEVAACQAGSCFVERSRDRRWLEKGSGGGNGDIYELRGARAIYIGTRYTKKQNLACAPYLFWEKIFC